MLFLPLMAGPVLLSSTGPGANRSSNLAGTVSSPDQGQAALTYRQYVRFWVHGDSIYPDVYRIRPGKVLLRFENQTSDDITVALERIIPGSSPQLLKMVSTVNRGYRADVEMTLEAGEYQLYEMGLPAYRGKLIVGPL
jgi:hypothetical protein